MDNFLTSSTLIPIFETWHFDFSIMRASILSYCSVCHAKLPVTIPMAVAVTSILTGHSLAIRTNLCATKTIHDISLAQLVEHVGESNQLSYSLSQCIHFLKIMLFYLLESRDKSNNQRYKILLFYFEVFFYKTYNSSFPSKISN